MRSQLRNGKITPPRTLREAVDRQRQLTHEIARIQVQLDDPSRVLAYPTTAEYDAWVASARHALKQFKNEGLQIAAWISTRTTAEGLLEEAYDLIKALQRELDDDFSPAEAQVVERLDNYFKKQTVNHAVG